MDIRKKRTDKGPEISPEDAQKIRRELQWQYGTRMQQCPRCGSANSVEPRSRKDHIVTVVCTSCGFLMQHDEAIFGLKN
jgi:transcription elongation factor Elf1